MINQVIAEALPLIPKEWIKPFAQRYVAGETIEEMLTCVRNLNDQGILATVDVLGEFIRHPREAKDSANLYHDVLDRIAEESLNANISIKLSQMGLLLDPALCYDILSELTTHAAEKGNFIRIDMEDSPCTSPTLEIYQRLRQQHSNVGIVLQAYMRRSMADARHLIQSGYGHFRLCKGIYRENRRIAYQQPALINRNFTWILEEMLRNKAYVGIATHDEALVWEATRLLDQYSVHREAYEFQMLLGVEPTLREIVLDVGHRLRVYVPFGANWYNYSLRRLRENPAIVGHIIKGFLNPA